MKISVIIPVYNVEKYLEESINSVINQKYSNLEIIIVDDGSTDNSSSICDNLEKQDNRIKVYHKKNGGLSSARNYGIKHSSGELICFIDSDDIISENMISILYNKLIDNFADVSICDCSKYFEGKQPTFFIDKSNDELYNSEESLSKLLRKKLESYACAKLYRRELFDDIEFPIGKNYEDIGTMYKIFSKCKRVIYNQSRLYGYLMRGNSITGSLSKKSFKDCIEMTCERYNFIKNNNKVLIDDNNFCFVICYLGFYKAYIKFFKNDEEIKQIINSLFDIFEYCYKRYKVIKKNYCLSNSNKLLIWLLYHHKIFLSHILTILYKIFK